MLVFVCLVNQSKHFNAGMGEWKEYFDGRINAPLNDYEYKCVNIFSACDITVLKSNRGTHVNEFHS